MIISQISVSSDENHVNELTSATAATETQEWRRSDQQKYGRVVGATRCSKAAAYSHHDAIEALRR